MPLPANGTLSLQGHSKPGDSSYSKPKQAMIVRMSEETLAALEAFPKMEFEFGDSAGIYIGEQFYPMRPVKENSPHELYTRATSATKPNGPLKLNANVLGKFVVERALSASVQEKVRDRTRDAEKTRQERKTIMVENPAELPRPVPGKKSKPEPSIFRKPPTQATAASRNLSATSQTSRVASPRVASPASNAPDSDAVNSMRKRMIHFVALHQPHAEEVVDRVGSKNCSATVRRQLLDILDEIAEPVPRPKNSTQTVTQYQLRPESWLEVRPFEWPQYSTKDRQTLARQARLAYARLKIPETDPIWDHARHRDLDGGPSTSTLPPSVGPSRTTAGGALTKITKTKKTKTTDAPRKKAADVPIIAKDESSRAAKEVLGKGKGRDTSELAGPSKATAASSGKPVVRRVPVIGQKASASASPPVRNASPRVLPSARNGSPSVAPPKKPGTMDVRTVKRDAPSPSLPPKPDFPMPTPSNHGRKTSGSSNVAVAREKRVQEADSAPAPRKADSARPRDPDRPRDKQLDRVRERERDKDVDRERPVKRKKPSPDEDESEYDEYEERETVAQKRRKTAEMKAGREKERVKGEERERARPKERERERDRDREREKDREDRERNREDRDRERARDVRDRDRDRDREERGRAETRRRERDVDEDIPLAKRANKRQSSPLASSKVKVKRESPLPARAKRELSPLPSKAKRDASPAPSKVKVKREATSSPLDRSPSPPPRGTDRRRSPSDVSRSEPRQRSTGSAKPRRKSPIYTSSEEDSSLPTPTTSDTRKDERVRTKRRVSTLQKLATLPTTRAGLREYYHKCWRESLMLHNEKLQRMNMIERLLKQDDTASCESDTDLWMLEPDELNELAAKLDDCTNELKRIYAAWESKGGRVDKGKLLD